ncbi:hypothetical protein [uncultured Tenacibaculum sp.]|uniref:hypothetical protein n=1 Tax=uncultured Tenacibaculum sp. TaxID=174713 RepID=UPI0026254ED7|nr:hypothetical protein [uncultured Tenacibaculum sp.]
MTFLKKNKKLLIALIIITISGIIAYSYVFKETEKVEDTKISFEGTSQEFMNTIGSNITEWNNKVIVLTGKISNIDTEGVIIDSSVFCQFSENQNLNTLKENQNITIKGMVVGYDDLLNELKLNQCILNK